jgi:ABC-type polar amino acid transport system ATPase subunit
MSNVLELINIRKSFGPELVLNDLSLTVPEHTATVLIGASGSGKSTLLRCINLLESIDDGQIFLDVAIIRSLAVSPRLLLLDEVTSALDPVLVNEVLTAVRDLKSDGMTMVLATHEMGFATQVADEVCFLESGNIVERGTAEQVLHNPQNPKTQEFLKRVHEAGRL